MLKANQRNLLAKIENLGSQSGDCKPSQEAKVDLGTIGSMIERALHTIVKPEILKLKDSTQAAIQRLDMDAKALTRQINAINPTEFDIPLNSTSIMPVSKKEIVGQEVGSIVVGKSKMIAHQVWKFLIVNKKSPHMAFGVCLASKNSRDKIRITPEVEKHGCNFFFANGCQRINGVSKIDIPEDQMVSFEAGHVIELSVDATERKVTLSNLNTNRSISVCLKGDDIASDIYPFVHLWEKSESVKIIA